MTSLLVAKQKIIAFFERYDVYIMPVVKFLLAFVCLRMINRKLGFMAQINALPVVLIAALTCSFMPRGFILVMSALFVLLHLYKLSLECALVIGAVFLLLTLLFLRFAPRDAIVILLTPMLFIMKLPYVMPIMMGLIGTPVSAVSVGCGVIVYYIISHIMGDTVAIGSMEGEAVTTKVRYMIDGIIHNKTMLVVAASFAVVLVIVYLVRRLSVDYAWDIAIGVGCISNIVVLLIMDLKYGIGMKISSVILGSIIAGAVAYVYRFLFVNLDYSRTEKVQFEDDDYYYYVKAVPKMTVSAPAKKVKKINSKKRRR